MEKIDKSDAEWRKQLTPEQYRVMREKGTERPFTGEYEKSKENGMYVCAACGNPLFSSDTKFDSGTGWPSFSQPVTAESVRTEEDGSMFMKRTEVLCSRCNAHLGHVFDDGPQPTGDRYCMNSVSLKLQKDGVKK
jgi:peptide-methionine (R)-S-oxide reductase